MSLQPKLTEAWIRLFLFCQSEFPDGEIKVRIAAGNPTELLEAKRKVRFDKGAVPTYTADVLNQ